MTFNVNPFRAVSFKKSAIEAALLASGSLTAEIKYDGVRGNIVVKPLPTQAQAASSATVLTRSNKALPALAQFDYLKRNRWAEFQREFMFPNGLIIDCEFMVKGLSFQKSSGVLRRKAQVDLDKLTCVVYDVLPVEVGYHNDDFPTPHCVRRLWVEQTVAHLKKHFPEVEWKASELFEVYSMFELEELYNEVRAKGHEGLVVKDPLGAYRRGKVTGWWKMKPEDVADGHVVSVNWGTEGLANEGKVIGFEVLSEDGHMVSANGLTDELQAEFTANVLKDPEFYTGWSVQFTFMERTDGGGFRHPNFDCWRGSEDNPKEKI